MSGRAYQRRHNGKRVDPRLDQFHPMAYPDDFHRHAQYPDSLNKPRLMVRRDSCHAPLDRHPLIKSTQDARSRPALISRQGQVRAEQDGHHGRDVRLGQLDAT